MQAMAEMVGITPGSTFERVNASFPKFADGIISLSEPGAVQAIYLAPAGVVQLYWPQTPGACLGYTQPVHWEQVTSMFACYSLLASNACLLIISACITCPDHPKHQKLWCFRRPSHTVLARCLVPQHFLPPLADNTWFLNTDLLTGAVITANGLGLLRSRDILMDGPRMRLNVSDKARHEVLACRLVCMLVHAWHQPARPQ